MARNVKPLTFTEVNKAKPKEKEYTLSDGQGLMLSIRPSGSKVWLFKYQKPFTKKRTNISFGSFPEISIADARKLRLEAQLFSQSKLTLENTNNNRRKENLQSLSIPSKKSQNLG